MQLFFVITLLTLTCFSSARTNDKPIIGVLAQEVRYPKPNQTAYIAASYVKFLESAGARVVPVMIDQTLEEYKMLFNSINGILFPGGAVSLVTSGYARAAKIFYDLAIEAKQKGDYFPVWGTCLGFEQLAYLTVDNLNKTVLTRTNTKSVSLPLNFTHDAKDSRMFKDFPVELMEALAVESLTENSHMWSVTTETYNTLEELKRFYKVISTNSDGKIEFISTMEAYDYPIYAVQWHPEKNAYEWTKPHYVHSSTAIKVSFYLADFFVNEARKNFNTFKNKEEESNMLIYNYSPVYTGRTGTFEQIYYF